MTPFEAKGWTGEEDFTVVMGGCQLEKGTKVWLKSDDGTVCPLFSDGKREHHLYLDWVEQMIQPITKDKVSKDTIFKIKLTGEELVYLTMRMQLTDHLAIAAQRLCDAIYTKLVPEIDKVCDKEVWSNTDTRFIERVLKEAFPPQETPEQKQYKELLAQREVIDAQLIELERGGKV
jgi:hypothetical protein